MDENLPFPVIPRAFDGASREVDAGASFDWLRHGWAMFMGNPGVWVGSSALFVVILIAISNVPYVGLIASHLLLPVFVAGFMQLCRHQADGGEPEIADLFVGFKRNAGPLVIVGVIFTIGLFGIAMLAYQLISQGILAGALTGRVAGLGVFSIGGLMLAGLLVLVLSVPVIMATWFAPPLVFFHDMQPIPAMRASFVAGVKNWLPMTIFSMLIGVAQFLLLVPALVFVAVFGGLLPASMIFVSLFWPLTLFVALVLLLPTLLGTMYASYRDIFVGV
jgi:hypothetical protein